jgi:hypothetical protein
MELLSNKLELICDHLGALKRTTLNSNGNVFGALTYVEKEGIHTEGEGSERLTSLLRTWLRLAAFLNETIFLILQSNLS